MLYWVPVSDIDLAWPIVGPMLEKALARSQHDFSIHDIYQDLKMAKALLVVFIKKAVITACATLKIIQYPQRKVCAIPLLTGTSREDWMNLEDKIVEFAREQGCSQLEGYCRDGWMRVLKNWKKVWTLMRRDI